MTNAEKEEEEFEIVFRMQMAQQEGRPKNIELFEICMRVRANPDWNGNREDEMSISRRKWWLQKEKKKKNKNKKTNDEEQDGNAALQLMIVTDKPKEEEEQEEQEERKENEL